MMFRYGTSIVKGWFDDDPNYFSEGLKVVKTISPTIFCEQLWPGIMISIQFRLFFDKIETTKQWVIWFGEKQWGGWLLLSSKFKYGLFAFDVLQLMGVWLKDIESINTLGFGCHAMPMLLALGFFLWVQGTRDQSQSLLVPPCGKPPRCPVVQARSVYGRRSSRFRFEAGGWEGGMLGHLTALWIPIRSFNIFNIPFIFNRSQ